MYQRIGFAALAALLAQSLAAEESAPTASDRISTDNSPATEVVVTAHRLPSPRLEFPGSITRLDSYALELIGPTHSAEALNRIAGISIQRGSGQESLPAIRSPVLTGPGSCGAFLVLEDGLPMRPIGFCNVNELFELNYEQAGAIEVVRGPGPAVYGANALHGIVNVITPYPRDLPSSAFALESGSDDYTRAGFKLGSGDGAAGFSDLDGGTSFGAYGLVTRDRGFRVDSGFDEAKLNLLADTELASGTLKLRASGTWLEQDTAGFILGENAYRDEALREANLNPEAFRNAWSSRLSAHWTRETCLGCTDALRAVVRRSEMEFLQHFLLGKPLEENGQTSLQLSGALQRPLGTQWSFHTGFDAETSDSELLESQNGPTLEGTEAARAIRPAGRHYDYNVRAYTAGAFGALTWQFAERWRLGAAARLEQTRYDYDNRMLAGNTDENGVPCAFGGCLYSRPADRKDSFTNFAPKLDLTFVLADNQRLYVAGARGFRPPEMTELYRLQRQQTFADLSSERVDSIELGWLGNNETLSWALAAYTLEKRHAILRDANAFNVSNGRTTHQGLEYELRMYPAARMFLDASGTFAWHRYDFDAAVEGGEVIVKGRDIDTASRNVHRLALGVFPTTRSLAQLEWAYTGKYFLDASNAHAYAGHSLVNAQLRYTFSPSWQTSLRINNVLDRRYADRADFAFGNYRYFPGRERGAFLEIAWTAR